MRTSDADELRARVHQLPWYHSIDLGHGVITPGDSKTPPLASEQLPDFAGRTVLDIGAWDGYYSFLAERKGASRVVALDHYVWGVDFAARDMYWQECRSRGERPDPDRDLTDFWRPDLLPGRRGFDFAHKVLGSGVEAVVGDFMTIDDALGSFDVVLFLGVLYHLQDPLSGVRRVRELTKEVAVIETEAIEVSGYPQEKLLLLFPGDELGGDYTNWYAPTLPALEGLCLAAGFSRVETKMGSQPFDKPGIRRWRLRGRWLTALDRGSIRHRRLVIHAYA